MKLTPTEIKRLMYASASRDPDIRRPAMDRLAADFWEAPVDYIRSRSVWAQKACSGIIWRQRLKAAFPPIERPADARGEER